MSDVMRHCVDPMSLDTFPVCDTVDIEVGDLLVLFDSDNMVDISKYGATANYKVYPFSAVSPGATATTQAVLASDHFVGVAMMASAAGQVVPIAVAQDGLFNYPLEAATTVYPKAVIMSYSAGSATGPTDQVVDIGTTNPIGRAERADGSSETEVYMRIATKYRPLHA